jgi:hypothetical protein
MLARPPSCIWIRQSGQASFLNTRPTFFFGHFSHQIFLHVGHCQRGGLRNPPISFLHREQKPLTMRSTRFSRPRPSGMGRYPRELSSSRPPPRLAPQTCQAIRKGDKSAHDTTSRVRRLLQLGVVRRAGSRGGGLSSQGGLKRLFGQTGLYSQALHLPTIVLEVASLSPSQYPCFSIMLFSASALS